MWYFTVARFNPLRHYDISGNNFWNPNKQLKYLLKLAKIFIFQIFFLVKPNYEHRKEDFTRRVIVHEIDTSGK